MTITKELVRYEDKHADTGYFYAERPLYCNPDPCICGGEVKRMLKCTPEKIECTCSVEPMPGAREIPLDYNNFDSCIYWRDNMLPRPLYYAAEEFIHMMNRQLNKRIDKIYLLIKKI